MAEERKIDTGTSQLLCTVKEGVAVLTLNRPEARNALSAELSPALRRMIAACGADDGVRAIMLTGAGSAFCAGGDVKNMGDRRAPTAETPDEKYRVVPYAELFIDAGFSSAADVLAAGIDIGSPVVYAPRVLELQDGRIAGTSVDDRAGCAVILEVARAVKSLSRHPTIHLVLSVQEEFNLRGALTAAQALAPDIAIQLDLMLATDTPDMAARGDVHLGGGPTMSLYSFHGRGTLNGTIPHPALVALFSETAGLEQIPLQRSAHTGLLTDSSYVQLVNSGVASIDLGFPARYTHSSLEVCDVSDLAGLARLLVAGLSRIGPGFSLDRNDFAQ